MRATAAPVVFALALGCALSAALAQDAPPDPVPVAARENPPLGTAAEPVAASASEQRASRQTPTRQDTPAAEVAEPGEAEQEEPEQEEPEQEEPEQEEPEQEEPEQEEPEQEEPGRVEAAAVASEPDPDPEPIAVPPHGSVGPPELIAEGDPAAAGFIGPRVMPNFRILGNEVLPGASARLEWSASQSFAGSEVISPVVVLHGVRPGTVLCLTAAIHGDELNGVEIVRRLTRQIDPQALSGTVIAVPIVNLFGFSRNSRYLPDRRDLNRFFPGSSSGSIASRIARSFFNNVVRHCDALVDFHTGSFDRSNLPQVRADLRLPEVLRFARGFGAVPVLHSDGNRGMLRVAASQAGIPAVTFEVGAPAILQPAEINAGVRAIAALLHHLGMIPIAPGEQEPQAIFYDSVWVRANGGGLLISEVELGQRVVPGQRLGYVVDPIQDIEREIVSPLYGRLIGMARNQVVLPGFAAYHVGEETSEARAVREAAAGTLDDPVEEDPDPATLDPEGPDDREDAEAADD